jgi:hypothetical protein
MKQAELINEVARLARHNFGDNAVEALVGLLSTVVTDAQLQALTRADWVRTATGVKVTFDNGQWHGGSQ